MLFLILGQSSPPIVVAQPDERHTNRTAYVLEWYDSMTDTERQLLVQTKKNLKITEFL